MALYLGGSQKLKINISGVTYVAHIVATSNKANSLLGTSILGVMKLGTTSNKTSAVLGVSALGVMKLGTATN